MTTFSKPNGVILLIEDKKESILLLNQAFRAVQVQRQLKITRSGNEAILYLKGSGIYNDRVTYPMPAIILLDVSNSDGSSMALIGWIREQKSFFSIPIVLLVDDETSGDLQRGLGLGANAYFLRKTEQVKIADLVKDLECIDQMNLKNSSSVLNPIAS